MSRPKRITTPREGDDRYEREIEIRSSKHGVNVSIQLYGKGGPIGAGITLPPVQAIEHLRNLADAISELPDKAFHNE